MQNTAQRPLRCQMIARGTQLRVLPHAALDGLSVLCCMLATQTSSAHPADVSPRACDPLLTDAYYVLIYASISTRTQCTEFTIQLQIHLYVIGLPYGSRNNCNMKDSSQVYVPSGIRLRKTNIIVCENICNVSKRVYIRGTKDIHKSSHT